ncbi:putative replication protein [Shigella sonnei]|nr:putative replication protein [Shigella sonnei]
MKNIATGGVLERIRRLTPPHVTAPFRTVAEWREWQLAEGQKRSEEINRLNRQLRVEKILNRSGIQPLHRKCSFANLPGAERRPAIRVKPGEIHRR